MRDVTHPVNNEKFPTDILASLAGKKNDRTGEVIGISPTSSWNTLRYLAEAYWICQ
jgi:hypothetical protein